MAEKSLLEEIGSQIRPLVQSSMRLGAVNALTLVLTELQKNIKRGVIHDTHDVQLCIQAITDTHTAIMADPDILK